MLNACVCVVCSAEYFVTTKGHHHQMPVPASLIAYMHGGVKLIPPTPLGVSLAWGQRKDIIFSAFRAFVMLSGVCVAQKRKSLIMIDMETCLVWGRMGRERARDSLFLRG